MANSLPLSPACPSPLATRPGAAPRLVHCFNGWTPAPRWSARCSAQLWAPSKPPPLPLPPLPLQRPALEHTDQGSNPSRLSGLRLELALSEPCFPCLKVGVSQSPAVLQMNIYWSPTVYRVLAKEERFRGDPRGLCPGPGAQIDVPGACTSGNLRAELQSGKDAYQRGKETRISAGVICRWSHRAN
jgi:hypothetical protein